MIYSHLNNMEKEKMVQDIIDSYIAMQTELMIQENNEANDFCWNVFESLNALNGEEKNFIVSYFFRKKNSSDHKSRKEMNKSQQKTIERFLDKIELK